MRTGSQLCVALGLVSALSGAGSLTAQGRTLAWPAVAVDAQLDARGELHVRERLTMRFTGDWNGGERVFNLRSGQRFELHRLARIDAVGGAPRDLTEGDLSATDHFAWANGTTLRWRSRLPSEPEFNGTELIYELEYSYANILVPERSGDAGAMAMYRLAHDFTFSDRYEPIAQFTLTLALDSAWAPPPGFTGRYEARNLPAGEGFVVTLPLTYLRTGRPAAVEFGAAREVRYALAAILLLVPIPLVSALVRRERDLGRFAAEVDAAPVTPEWLETHVFRFLPEVVGAAWDNSTSSAEVAAVIARLVQEKKLSSAMKGERAWIFPRTVLHLHLETSRDTLAEHERVLVDSLFLDGAYHTSTEIVRKHYATTGFDPAALIRKHLEFLVTKADPTDAVPPVKPARTLTLSLLGAAIALLLVGGTARATDGAVALVGSAIAIGCYLFALIQAALWRSRVRRLPFHALRFALPLALAVGALAFVLLDGRLRTGAFVLAGLVALLLAFVNSTLNQAKARQSMARIALRRELARARDYFRDQLARPNPNLRDAWFPYVVAFGLGRQVDRWFSTFGGENNVGTIGPMVVTGAGSDSGARSWTGFGGGGGFSGGGSSASFASAIGGMAASVPSPSSGGSSSGGSSSGGSSGGGGGGGW